jgi:hypothetical protein
VLRELWEGLFLFTTVTPALETAMASPHALGLLERAGIGRTSWRSGLPNGRSWSRCSRRPPSRAWPRAPPARPCSPSLPPRPTSCGDRLRPAWLRNLREGVGLEIVWLAVEAAVASDTSGRIVRRLIRTPTSPNLPGRE